MNSMSGVSWWIRGWWIYYVGPGFGAIVTSIIVWFLWGSFRPPSSYEQRDDRVEDEPIKSEVV